MPKIVKKKTKVRTRSSSGTSKKKIILFIGIVIFLAGIVYVQPWKFVGERIISLSQGQAVTMPTPESKPTKSIYLEPDKAKTVFLKTEKGTTISLYFPQGSVGRKMPVNIAVANDETGVIMRPEGTKFLRPVSITFDLSGSSQRTDAPEKIDTNNPRTTGTTHLYSVDSKGNVSPVLIARGMETSVIISGRTLFTGAYVLRTDDKSAEKYAKATLDDSNSYFFSTLEAAATLLGNKQPLSDRQQANAKAAVDKVLAKKAAPLFELYAALVVKKGLESNTTSFIGKAYAQTGFDLKESLRKQCSEDTHTTETYINAELVAQSQGFLEIAALCRQTGDKVLRRNAQQLFNNPNATFEEVMVMIGQIKSIEGTNSILLTNMENKLKQVVEREMYDTLHNPSVSMDDISEAWDHREFTNVDPALSKELDRVTFIEARESIEKILAKECPSASEILYAKSLVIQYKLEDLKSKVYSTKECSGGGIAAPGDDNPPPPPPGGGESKSGGSTVPPVIAGTCWDPHTWSYGYHSDHMCQVCYDIVTNDDKLDYIETKCIKYACTEDAAIWERVESHKCQLQKDYESGKHTDPEWKDLEPLPEDLPIPDTLNGTEGQNNSSNDNMSGEGSSNEGGSSDGESSDTSSDDQTRDPSNPYDFDL